jgi:V-type H+-transporting ATPase subunit C
LIRQENHAIEDKDQLEALVTEEL